MERFCKTFMKSWLLLIAVNISSRSIASYSHSRKVPWEIGGGGSRKVPGLCQVVNIRFYWGTIYCRAFGISQKVGSEDRNLMRN